MARRQRRRQGDIKYVKRNFLPLFREAEKERGRDTPDAGELAEELERWNRESCDQHVVQKVGRTPLELFESEEAQALRPLPMTRWDPVVCKELSVGPDWRVQFDKAFYTVPYRLIGERVLVLGSSQDRAAVPGGGGGMPSARGPAESASEQPSERLQNPRVYTRVAPEIRKGARHAVSQRR